MMLKLYLWLLFLFLIFVEAKKHRQATEKEMDHVLSQLTPKNKTMTLAVNNHDGMSYYCVGEAYTPFLRTKVFKDVPHCSIKGWTQSLSFMAYNQAIEGSSYFSLAKTPQNDMTDGIETTFLSCSTPLSPNIAEWWLDGVTNGPPDVKITYLSHSYLGDSKYSVITTIDRKVDGATMGGVGSCSFGDKLTWDILLPVSSNDANYISSISSDLTSIWKRENTRITATEGKMVKVITNAIAAWTDDTVPGSLNPGTRVSLCADPEFQNTLRLLGLYNICLGKNGRIKDTNVRIDLQGYVNIRGLRYANLQVQVNTNTYANALVPVNYRITARSIRNALVTSMQRRATTTVSLNAQMATGGPDGGPVPPQDVPIGTNWILTAVSFIASMIAIGSGL